MVGKSTDKNSSHIFQQCYVKCCKLQNINPVSGVLPSNGGKCVDFCVDRIKYAEWGPILNALSCDLSLHSVSVRCRQQVKTILEHVDCERLAKTVNKRAVILTKFMLGNLVEALAQCLSTTTLLASLLLEGLPLRVPYINPLVEAIGVNNSLQHLYLPRCLVGDAGCLAVCNVLRGLPNILTLDLSSCELTALGASYIADVVKYQKIHRYSENWKHTLRYRLPQLDSMSGLRRITLCGNPALGDRGAAHLLDVLADDLWIKAVDLQWCGLTETSATTAEQVLRTNTALAVLDLRHNEDISCESLASLRTQLRQNDGGSQQYNWLNSNGGVTSSDGKGHRTRSITIDTKDRFGRSKSNGRYIGKSAGIKKDRDSEQLSEQLAEEASHRRQLEELNLQLVKQMRQLKQEHVRMWASEPSSSGDLGSERSCETSERSEPCSSCSGSSSVTIDHNTLAYIQQAFRDIYAFIKDNQCQGQCRKDQVDRHEARGTENGVKLDYDLTKMSIDIAAKKAHSTHVKIMEHIKNVSKSTKSACLIGDSHQNENNKAIIQGMLEKRMGDSKEQNRAALSSLEEIMAQTKTKVHERNGGCSREGTVSDSSDTLVHSPCGSDSPRRVNPRDAFYSSSSDDDEDNY